MAEVNKTASAPPSTGGTRSGTGFELRLERGGASVRLAGRELEPGLCLELLSIQIPDVRFPFDVGLGANQFRHRLADLSELVVTASKPWLEAALQRVPLAGAGLLDVRLELRAGFAELSGRLAAGPPFTARAGLLADRLLGLRLILHSPRVYGAAPFPAAALPGLLGRALSGTLGEQGSLDPLGPLLRTALAPRGWKLPRSTGVRLCRAEIAAGLARVGWSSTAPDASSLPGDPELLSAEEGGVAFPGVGAALAEGDFARAREELLAAGSAPTSHPFAAEQLLSLLVLEERFHDEALDLAAGWLERRPGFAPALTAEALVRQARNEQARAARAWAELARGSAARGEAFAALAAAEAAFALPFASPEDAARAVDVALSVRRDHVPALRALRALAVASGEREALVRADRRIVAYDPDDAQRARAHAELGELLREADPAAARLHLDQALRLAPDDPRAVAALARACLAAGETLRAARTLDRLRELHLAREDRAAAAAAALEAGALWDGPLGHPENALLRYRAAVELVPSADGHGRAAAAAERLGQWAEAADHHAALLAALDPAAPGAPALLSRTRLALAEVAEKRLNDPAGAAAHLEAAAALLPGDAALLRRLAALHRTLGRPDGLAAALDRLAPLSPAGDRAGLLAEAGQALLGLGRAEAARGRFTAALAHDPACRPALQGLVKLAVARGDAQAEREALARLLPLAGEGGAAADLQDQVAAACERSGDLAGAVRAARAARAAAPSAARLDAELRLLRAAGDLPALTSLLPEAAQAAAAAGDSPRAAALRLEQARLLARDAPAAALSALAEAHAAAPGDVQVLRAQAELAERTGDLRLALGALRALLGGAPPDAPALELRAGRAALEAEELGPAREHATRAEAAGVPGAAELLDQVLAEVGDGVARAGLLQRMGRTAEAAELFQAGGRPGQAAPLLAALGRHLEAGLAYQAAGEVAPAREALAHAARDPASAGQALASLAELHLRAGDRPGAAAALLALAGLRGGREGAGLALRSHDLDPRPAALDAAIEADPTFAPARARRAAARADSDPRGALTDAEAALSAPQPVAPEDGPALLALAARAAAGAGDARAEARHLSAFSALAPDDVAALERLAELHRRAGEQAALAAVLDRRIPATRGPEGARLRLERAALHAGEGDGAAAAALLEEALLGHPGSLPVLRALAGPPAADALPPGRRAEVLGLLGAHPEADPVEGAAALTAQARLLAQAGEPVPALQALRAAAARAPQDDAALELRADLAAKAGQATESARALLERAERARARAEPGAAERLVEAGLAGLAAGLPEAPPALAAALELRPARDSEWAARQALVERARAQGEVARERELLSGLVPLLRTGERPAALLRLSALARAGGDVVAARASAEEARLLSPRDPVAVEAARATAEAEGDLAAVADRLGELSELVPGERTAHLLARARLLAFLGRAEEADRDLGTALALLPPDRALAEEQVRLRRESLPRASAAEPLEAYGRRAVDPADAARAFRAAAVLNLDAEDRGGALRCARRAYARTQADPAYAGPLLARILYQDGSWAEALVVHRRLLEHGLDKLPTEEALLLARQLAELAEETGDPDLARTALGQVLGLRHSDLEAGLRRFALDRDRARAVRELAAQADLCRSAAQRSRALATAAESALREVGDAPLSETLFRRARDAAQRLPALAAALARRRVEALRAAEGNRSPALAGALAEAAEQALRSGDREGARKLLVDAGGRARDRGQLESGARSLLRAAGLAAEDRAAREAAALAREAGELLAWDGRLDEAQGALQQALGHDPADAEALRLLEGVARAQGAEGAPLLAELLGQRVARAQAGPDRAALRVALAETHALAGGPGAAERAEAELRLALADDPSSRAAAEALLLRLAETGRDSERAHLLLDRAGRETDPAAAAALRREAAGLLAPGSEVDQAAAAEAYAALTRADPGDRDAHRAAARLLRGLGRGVETVPHLLALVRADPDDELPATELAEAWADRPHELAEIQLERAEAALGARRAARLGTAARTLVAAGEEARARSTLLAAFQAWPADDTAFVAALQQAAADVERIDAVLSDRADAVPAEAGACHRARADALLAFGEVERAAIAYQQALASAPGDVTALAALAACLSTSGRAVEARAVDEELLVCARANPRSVPPSAESQARYRLGLAAWAAGYPADAIGHLERALSLAPSDDRAGVAWAALAAGHAARGDRALALGAARSRVERAGGLGLTVEWRKALEAGAELAAQLDYAGRDALEILDALVRLRASEGEAGAELAGLARRAAEGLEAVGDVARAEELRKLAGIEPEPVAVAEPPVELEIAAEPVAATFPELLVAAEPAAEPVVAVASAPEPAPEPVVEVASAPEPAPEPVVEVASAPEPAPEPVVAVASAPEPAPEPVVAVASAPEPAPEPVVELATAPEPADEPAAELIFEPELGDEPAAELIFEPEPGDEPVSEALARLAGAAQVDEVATAAADAEAIAGAGPSSTPEPTPPPELEPEPEPEPQPEPELVAAPPAPTLPPPAAAEPAPAIEDPVARAAALLARAGELRASGAPTDEVRSALDQAAEADPDSAEPWQARARLESEAGQPVDAAKAHLAVSIRAEGDVAAGAALEAARLFEQAGLPAEALRAYRAAIHAQPGSAPARDHLARQAMEVGDFAAAAGHLAAIRPEALPPEARPDHYRRLAMTLEAAGRHADAEAVWLAILQGDPDDAEAYQRAAALVRARGALGTWLSLAHAREQALERLGDDAGRAHLRAERGKLLAAAGRLEAAQAALRSALHLVPDHGEAAQALAELEDRRDAWARTAEELAAEAASSHDPAQRASLHLRRAHILTERLHDPAGAGIAAEQALVEARTSTASSAGATGAEAEALLQELGPKNGEPPPTEADPVAAVLRVQAGAARGRERSELFERLAGHLERAGDRDGAADALLAALEADPERDLTYSWLRSLATGDPARLARAAQLAAERVQPPEAAPAPPRITLRFDLEVPAGDAGPAPAAAPAPVPGPEPLEPVFEPDGEAGTLAAFPEPAREPVSEPEPSPPPVGEPQPPPPAPEPPPDQEPPPPSAAEEPWSSGWGWAPPEPLPDLELELPLQPPAPAALESSGSAPEAALPGSEPATETEVAPLTAAPAADLELAAPALDAPPLVDIDPFQLEPGVDLGSDLDLGSPPEVLDLISSVQEALPALDLEGPAPGAPSPAAEAPAPELELEGLADLVPPGADQVPPLDLEALPVDLDSFSTPPSPRLTPPPVLEVLPVPEEDLSPPEPVPEAFPAATIPPEPEPTLELDALAAPAPGPALQAEAEPIPAAGLATGAPALPVEEPEPDLEFVLPSEIEPLALEADAEPELEFADLPLEDAPESSPAASPPDLGEVLARRGREYLEDEEWELAYADLSEALERAPTDVALLRDLMRAAEKLGQADRLAELGQALGDELAPRDRASAAAELRRVAGVLRGPLGQPQLAAPLLEEVLALFPGDAEVAGQLAAARAERPRPPQRPLEAWLERSRQNPGDETALATLAAQCALAAEGAEPVIAARLHERGRIAASLAAFLASTAPRAFPPRLPTRIGSDLRAAVGLPPAVGSSARLLGLLAPWLEPLFPADLARRGASSADWLAPPRAPALRTALEGASRALSARPHAAFLTRRPGVEVNIENTQPPAMVFSAGVAELPEAMLPFLTARTLDLVQHGWALAGKFAPRDVGILLELACRYSGGTAPSFGLPAERAGAYLSALARTVPAGVLDRARLLAPEAARELAGFEPRSFADAVRRTANRVGLLYAGEPATALRALIALEPAAGSSPDPVKALAHPDLTDLARFALSDAFLELRLAVAG